MNLKVILEVNALIQGWGETIQLLGLFSDCMLVTFLKANDVVKVRR